VTRPDSNHNYGEIYFSSYQAWEIDIPEHNGDNGFALPIPATYIIDTDATICYAFVEMDYTQRSLILLTFITKKAALFGAAFSYQAGSIVYIILPDVAFAITYLEPCSDPEFPSPAYHHGTI
jgi:hypothetical protein